MPAGKQLFFIDQFFHANKTSTRSGQFLRQLSELINWSKLAEVVSVLDKTQSGKGGRPRHDAIMMIKALFLQHLYGLSDPALEDQLNDRLSFQEFVGISLAEKSPDMRTFWKFKDELVKAKLLDSLFSEINRQLQEKQLFVDKGIIVDATLVPSSNRPVSDKKRQAEGFHGNNQLDKDAKSTKKNGVYTFGYKGHIGIDVGSSLIRTRVYTPANEYDSKFTERLAADFGGALFGDKGYADDRLKKMARQFGWFYCILDKAKKRSTFVSFPTQTQRQIQSYPMQS